jgi:hypothetical protein
LGNGKSAHFPIRLEVGAAHRFNVDETIHVRNHALRQIKPEFADLNSFRCVETAGGAHL